MERIDMYRIRLGAGRMFAASVLAAVRTGKTPFGSVEDFDSFSKMRSRYLDSLWDAKEAEISKAINESFRKADLTLVEQAELNMYWHFEGSDRVMPYREDKMKKQEEIFTRLYTNMPAVEVIDALARPLAGKRGSLN